MNSATDQEPCSECDHGVLLWDAPTNTTGLGGKGRSLADLVAAGMPVPRTGVVTITAYNSFIGDPRISELISAILEGQAVGADDVDQAFHAVHLSPDLRTSITNLARAVGGADGEKLAIRSSATVEDLAGSSFAGQYRSVLEVDSTDEQAVIDAVTSVWASLWHPAPTAYRRAFGIAETGVAMAVVVMAMVPATTAGVVFTADPGGSPGSARVETVEGLGESLVSGERTPKAWVVARDSSEDLPSIEARALELSMAIEGLSGRPQDVEWAAVGDEVHIVQARPITVLETDDGFDSPYDEHELTTAGIVEMVPGVLGALSWDVNSFLVEEAFRAVLAGLGLGMRTPAVDRTLVRRVRGRVALDFDLLRSTASDIPGAVQELEEQYFGITDDVGEEPSRSRSRLKTILRGIRTSRTRRRAIDAAEVLIATVEKLRDNPTELPSLHDDALLAHAQRLVDLASRGLAAELGVAAAAAAAHHRLEQLLEPHLGTDAPAAALRVISVDRGRTRRTEDASAAIFAGPSWREIGMEPTVPASMQRDTNQRDALEARLTALPGWRRKRIMTGQIVDVRIHLIRRTIADAAEQLERREATKAAFLELGGAVRRAHLEMGERLVSRGALRKSSDIELLSTTEVVAALGGRSPTADVLGRRGNWLTRFESEGELPVRFVGVPDRTPVPLPEGDTFEGWAASGGRFRGRACVARSADAEIPEGAVLVAESTDASWSPLFVRAGAVIVERGGPLSHAAILARELGLPAVLNVQAATSFLDGRTVWVDGDQGLVVIDEADESG